jgi:hypothetical protein
MSECQDFKLLLSSVDTSISCSKTSKQNYVERFGFFQEGFPIVDVFFKKTGESKLPALKKYYSKMQANIIEGFN